MAARHLHLVQAAIDLAEARTKSQCRPPSQYALRLSRRDRATTRRRVRAVNAAHAAGLAIMIPRSSWPHPTLALPWRVAHVASRPRWR